MREGLRERSASRAVERCGDRKARAGVITPKRPFFAKTGRIAPLIWGKKEPMPRAIWTGSISFGLLNVPVKLYTAVSKKNVSFRELRESDGSRVRHKRVAEEDGEEVPYEKIVKGYEIAPDQYVIMTRDELEEIDPKKTRAIEIEDFVDLDEIDPIYFDHPYYLGPDKGAEKAYKLLVKAMED